MDFVMDNFPPDRVVFGVDYPLCEGAEPGVHAKCTRPNRFWLRLFGRNGRRRFRRKMLSRGGSGPWRQRQEFAQALC